VTNVPSISFRSLIQKVKQLGFEAVRQKGSHIRFVHGIKDVPQGLLVKIIRYDLEMKIEDFFR
jgi:predicted RNA binding protein YcfA (HicA-like mRNA interferase family)